MLILDPEVEMFVLALVLLFLLAGLGHQLFLLLVGHPDDDLHEVHVPLGGGMVQ